ncbi:MAG TPA: hypothetical protein VFN75_02160 [Pseudonocardiaceae bacterium]|nr:hypothetical protein [Pseudonocardiaceae bacterium]
MADQLGKHDATGPRARRADGTVDPAGYLKFRLASRRDLAVHAVILCAWCVILVVRGGSGLPFSVVLVASILMAEFAILRVLRLGASYRERQRRAAGHAPAWPASLICVLQAREAGFDIPPRIRSDSGLRGRLTDDGDQWVWTGQPTRTHPGSPTIVLRECWSPTVHHKRGYRHFLTFTDQEGRRLDFRIGARRDLVRHLRGHRR